MSATTFVRGHVLTDRMQVRGRLQRALRGPDSDPGWARPAFIALLALTALLYLVNITKDESTEGGLVDCVCRVRPVRHLCFVQEQAQFLRALSAPHQDLKAAVRDFNLRGRMPKARIG